MPTPIDPPPSSNRTGGAVPADAGAKPDQRAAVGQGELAGSGARRGRSSEDRKEALDRVAASLRNAYEATVTEQVPDSLLDLLRKLD